MLKVINSEFITKVASGVVGVRSNKEIPMVLPIRNTLPVGTELVPGMVFIYSKTHAPEIPVEVKTDWGNYDTVNYEQFKTLDSLRNKVRANSADNLVVEKCVERPPLDDIGRLYMLGTAPVPYPTYKFAYLPNETIDAKALNETCELYKTAKDTPALPLRVHVPNEPIIMTLVGQIYL